MKGKVNKMEINLDVLKSDQFENEFATTFCDMLINKLETFKSQYKSYLLTQNVERLEDITHDLVASLRFLLLSDMADLINEYKSINYDDYESVKQLIDDVSKHCIQLRDALRKYKNEELSFKRH